MCIKLDNASVGQSCLSDIDVSEIQTIDPAEL